MVDHNIEPSGLVDPELLDVLLQGISVLSNVATMAGTWLTYRNGNQAGQNRNDSVTDAIRSSVRMLRRNLEDCFDAVADALRILQSGILAAKGSGTLLEKQPRFGNSVYLQPSELSRLNGQLSALDMAAMNARQALRNIQTMVQQSGMPNTEHMTFDVDTFNTDLNSVLFDSRTFEEAMIKLRSLQNRAEDFVTELSVALRGN